MAFGAQGTGVSSPTSQLVGTLNATTQKYIVPYLGDAVMVPSPVLWAFNRKGVQVQSGAEIVYPVVTVEEMTGGAYYGNQLLQTTTTDSIQPANQLWKPYYQSVVIPGTDIILNTGIAGVLDLTRSKFEIGCSSLLQKMSRSMWHITPQNTTQDIDDLIAWVVSSTNTIAGFDRTVAANAFWLATAATSNTSGVLTVANAEIAYQSVVFGYEEADLMVIAHNRYAGFKTNFTQNVRFTDNEQDSEVLQAGFRRHFMFNNAVVMPDRYATTGNANGALILNTKYIYPVFHARDYFKVEPFMRPSDQRVYVTQVYMMWNLICQSPRMNTSITNITV
jgi:hypothetical protein